MMEVWKLKPQLANSPLSGFKRQVLGMSSECDAHPVRSIVLLIYLAIYLVLQALIPDLEPHIAIYFPSLRSANYISEDALHGP